MDITNYDSQPLIEGVPTEEEERIVAESNVRTCPRDSMSVNKNTITA